MAAGAVFTLAGEGSGQRSVAASDFFLGYRNVDMQPHEILLKVGMGTELAAFAPALSWGLLRQLGIVVASSPYSAPSWAEGGHACTELRGAAMQS